MYGGVDGKGNVVGATGDGTNDAPALIACPDGQIRAFNRNF